MRFLLLISLMWCAGLPVGAAGTRLFPAPKADVTVAADGTGDVRTVSEALAKVPENNRRRFVIYIKKGVYVEQVRVPATKPYVSFVGESAETTRISFDLNNQRAGTTSAAYAVYIGGHDFHAENLTFENSYAYRPGQTGAQAVALLAEADRLVFRNCRFLGWQDTLYVKNGRQFFENCYIEGNVDFIFGQASAVFEKCTIHSKGDGYIAAPMRFADDEPSGLIFVGSKLTAANVEKGVYLARPWRPVGRAVFIDTEMGAHIRAEGWHNWGSADHEKTAFFAEFGSTGAGAKAEGRVRWARPLTRESADSFRAENFLRGRDGWNPRTATDAWREKTPPDWQLVGWAEVLRQKPHWYQTDEAARIADQVVLYQKANGGWEKNVEMARMLTQAERETLARAKSDISDTTIDNRATYTQIAFLAKVVTASLEKKTPPNGFPKHREAFDQGVDFLLAAQYENGGWPQYFPLKKGYYTRVTFNDNALVGVLRVLRDIAERRADYRFVDEARRARAAQAVARALPMILQTQVAVGGRKTVWAQQYDEKTLAPAPARTFEPVCLTAGESVGVVRFLMDIEKPDPPVVEAVEAAVEWFRARAQSGLRWERRDGQSRLVKDKAAPPLWARFYEIATQKPIFLGRDSVVHYDVMEIEPERRNGYAWYVTEPGELLEKDYPKWRARLAAAAVPATKK